MKTYEKEFKEEAVKLALETSVSKASISIGIPEGTLRHWVSNTKTRPEAPFVGSGKKYISEQEREIARLKKELKEANQANEVLKKAMAFFARSQKK